MKRHPDFSLVLQKKQQLIDHFYVDCLRAAVHTWAFWLPAQESEIVIFQGSQEEMNSD